MTARRRSPARIDPLEPRRLLSGAIVHTGQQPQGPLAGRIVYTSPGHGWTARNTTTGTWYTQRGDNNEIVEDFGNQDQFTFYVDYLWRAGATVVPLRPVGHQPREVVLDNTSPGVSFSGGWSNGSGSPYFGAASDPVRYRFANVSSVETAVATYTPDIPEAGHYPVYAWALDGSNRVNQLYRVVHSGGATEVRIDHRLVGKGWVYLGTYHFDAGTAGRVEISNQGSGSGVVIADAIRFGNGMGDVDRGAGASGFTREDEQALYWIMRMAGVGTAESVYRGGNSDDGDANVGAPARYAAYMNAAPFGQSVYLGWHSNAGGGRGTVGLFNNESLFPNTATPNQQAWALLVAREINDDLVAIGSPPLESPWFARTSLTFARSDFAFGEIRTSATSDEFDATIIEVAFHDNALDAALMRDPKARDWVGRSAYQATVRYFDQYGGLVGTNLLPDPPTDVRATTSAAGEITVSWDAPLVDGIGGQAPTGYRIYASNNGYGFDGGTLVSGAGASSHTFTGLDAGQGVFYFRVVALNAGGESAPSPVVAAAPVPTPAAPVLIVTGFDRFDRTLNIRQPYSGQFTDRVRPRFMNSFDYAAQAAEAIRAHNPGLRIDTAPNEAVAAGEVSLADYQAVIWLLGEESTADDTLNPAEQSAVSAYLSAGGRLFISGSEIGWDLVAQGGGAAFYTGALRSSYVSDDAGTYNVAGAANSIFAGLSLSFDDGDLFYNVDFPDRLAATNGSTLAMTYSGGLGGGAAIQYQSGRTRLVNMGFPFETITTAANRAAVMARVLDFFDVRVDSLATAAPALEAASDTGLSDADGVTRLNNASPGSALSFVVAGTAPGATITLLIGGVPVGSAIATGATTTVLTNGALLLGDGAYAVTIVQQEPLLAPTTSPAGTVTIDATAPQVVSSGFDMSAPTQRVRFELSESTLAPLDPADLQVTNLTSGTPVSGAAIAVAVEGASVRFSFPGLPSGTLPDGDYQATLLSGGVSDLAGNPLPSDAVLHFFFLLGDANGDRVVDVGDLGILATNWQQAPRTYGEGDLNYDGVVDVGDLGILAGRWQAVLSPSFSGQRPAPGEPPRRGAPFAKRGAPTRVAETVFSKARVLA